MENLTIANRAIGIDIGASSVKVVSMQNRLGTVTIEKAAEAPISRSESGTVSPEALKQALQAALEGVRVRKDVIVAGVSTQAAAVRTISIPFSDTAKARAVIKFQAEPHLPFPIEDVIIDFFNTGTGTEERMDVLLTAIRKQVILEQIDMARAAGIDPEVIEVDFMAAANTIKRIGPNPEEGVMIIDIGASKTIVSFVKNGTPLGLRAFPVGGDTLTNAIAKKRGVSFEEAERIKLDKADASANSETSFDSGIAEAIKPVLDRFSGEIGRTLRFLNTQLSTEGEYKVVLTGGGALLKGMPEYIKDVLGHDVTIIRELDPIRNNADPDLSPAKFATAIGLGMRGLGQTDFLQNFRQEELAYSRAYRRLRLSIYSAVCLLGAIIITYIAGLFVNHSAASGRVSRIGREIRSEIVSTIPYAPTTNDPEQLLKEFKKEVIAKRKELKDLTGTEVISVLSILKAMSDSIPKKMEVMLEELLIDALPPILITSGTAKTSSDINEIEKLLNSSELFKKVVFDRIEWQNKIERFYFKLKAELK